MAVLFISLSDVSRTFITIILQFLYGLFCVYDSGKISCFNATIGLGNVGIGSSSSNSLLWSQVCPTSRSGNTAGRSTGPSLGDRATPRRWTRRRSNASSGADLSG